MASGASYRLGVDIGGTFTDMALISSEGDVHVKKVSSSTDNYARAIGEGLQALLIESGVPASGLSEIVHGTTVATNTILELRGAHTGLITTRGFRDVLEMRRIRMPVLYDPQWDKPRPLVERRWRREVGERMSFRGEVLRPLDEASVERELSFLRDEGIESLAVCLINSYANPEHERRIGEIAAAILPGVYISLSSDVLPEIREYERTSTTVVNAYILPVVERYLRSLSEELKGGGVRAPLLVMQSNGGVMTAEAAARRPMHIVESGPAAGVIGSARLGERAQLRNLITFDMGGTTAKASIVEEGEINRAGEFDVGAGISMGSRLIKGGGYLLRAPAIDIAEVGAGGRSAPVPARRGTSRRRSCCYLGGRGHSACAWSLAIFTEVTPSAWTGSPARLSVG